MKERRTDRVARLILAAILGFLSVNASLAGEEDAAEKKAREIIESAIEAMGGDAYRNVETMVSNGRFFWFQKGRKAFSRYQDWTTLDPIRSRFQLGKKADKPDYVEIYNLELGKAWKQEGLDVEELPEKKIEDFKRAVKEDVDVILRQRLNEEGMTMYYYGPDEIAGQGEYEAIEFLDLTNDSVIVFFSRKTHLPSKIETSFTDEAGIRRKREQEYSNWHVVQGVNMPLRFDTYVDGEISSQRFIEKIALNESIPPEYFLEPKVEKKD